MAETRKPKKRDAEATQRRLLEAGAELFAEIGYEAATLERLAEAAGVTKAMVRYHFEDKGGLYRAVLEESFDHIALTIAAARDADLQPAVKLTAYVRTLAKAIQERPHIGALLVTDYAAGRIAHDKALTASLMRFSQSTATVLAEGQRAGAFRKLDAHLFHLWLVGAIAVFVASQKFRDEVGQRQPWSGPAPTFERFVKLLQELALKGATA
jgi:TetR/AcrR family transcriptional regulator